MTDEPIVGRFGSGREVRRIEDAELLVGAGRFVDDVSLPSQAHMRFLRSPHAHARIVSIHAEAAKAMPGVITVLTGADLAAAGVKRIPLAPMFHRPDGSPGASPLRPALAEDTVRFVGEGIAASIAETVDQAKDALEAITVEYEELPVVTGVKEATAEGRAAGVAGGDRQYRGADASWRRRPRRRGVQQRRACCHARPRQSKARAHSHGAAQRAGEL